MRAHLPPVLLLLAACGGGGGGSAVVACSGSQGLCLVSCSLGCGDDGCGVAQIAENEVLTFTFNRPIDQATIPSGGIQLASASGELPAGSFWATGTSVSFVPAPKILAGSARFGFKANETYTLRLAGGTDEPLPLRAMTGQALERQLSCSLQVTRGIVDQDGQPPRMTLVTPGDAQRAAAPRDGKIVVRFSEAIDASVLFGQSSADSPLVFRLRRTRLEASQRVCDPGASPVILEGALEAVYDPAAQGTVVTLSPSIVLPSLSCVEVELTRKVKDLAGTAALPAFETFQTEAGPGTDLSVAEVFASPTQLDAAASSGAWGAGALVPGAIGGDGLHGDFDPSDGQLVAPDTWLWSTDDQKIRAVVWKDTSPPLSPVTDGVFRFASLRIPAGTTVIFAGRNAARILVRGNLLVSGRLVVNGADVGAWDGTLAAGQPGAAGGAGGARGGPGADLCQGTGALGGAYSGRDGEDVRVAASHAYAGRATGTRGRGASLYPVSGKNADVTYRWSFDQFCAMVPAGGGGGGNEAGGGDGKATASPTAELGPSSAGGTSFDAYPVPAPSSSLEHFVIGGAGGGGGGSHALLSTKGFPSGPHWFSGGAGAGGGGAIALRAGRDLTLAAGSAILARGGSGFAYGLAQIAQGPPAPGGGGAGGSVLLQSSGTAALQGSIDVRGGAGSSWDLSGLMPASCRGGDGAPGALRLELPVRPELAAFGVTLPPAQSKCVDALRDTDPVVGTQSRWYTTRQAFPPAFLRYEAEVEQGNGSVRRIYSDDPSKGPLAGFSSGQPITVLVQGAVMSPASAILAEGGVREWRDRVGPFASKSLDADGVNGFRFVVLFDRRVAPDAVLRRLTIVFREKP